MRHVHLLRVRAEAAGVSVDDSLRSIGLDPEQLGDPDGRVPLAALESVLERRGGSPSDLPIGLELARDVGPATFGTLGLIIQACSRFSDVLEALVRFNGLSSSVGHVSVLHTLDGVHVRWECRAGGPHFRRHATEYVLASFVGLVRRWVPGGDDHLRGVRLAQARPERRAVRERYRASFGVPVTYDEPVACVVLDPAVLALRMPGGDALVKDLLEQHTVSRLGRRAAESSFADAVRAQIAALMVVRAPTRDAVARRMGTSVRSLVRRLGASGTSFRELLDDERARSAEERLRGTGDGIDSVASALGFGSARAFSRWFKARSGRSPGDFRTDARETR